MTSCFWSSDSGEVLFLRITHTYTNSAVDLTPATTLPSQISFSLVSLIPPSAQLVTLLTDFYKLFD